MPNNGNGNYDSFRPARREPQLPAGTPYGESGGSVYAQNPSEAPIQGEAAPSTLQLMLRRKWLIVMFGVLGTLAGLVYILFDIPVYRALTAVEVQGVNESFMNMNAYDPQAGTGAYATTTPSLLTQVRIMTSGTMLGRTYERVSREATPVSVSANDAFSRIRSRLGIFMYEPVRALRQAVDTCAQSLVARPQGLTRIIEASCQSTNPDIAAQFLNSLVSEYITQNLQARSAATQATGQWLSGQVEDARTKVTERETRLQQFVKQSGLAFIAEPETLAGSKLKQLQTELAAIQAERIQKQTRYDLIQKASVDAIPEIMDDPTLRNLQVHIGDLRREKAQLLTIYTAEHYKVKRVDVQLAELETNVRGMRTTVLERLKNEYESVARRERALQGAYSGQAQILASQTDNAAEYATYKRELEVARQNYNTLLQQLNQASVAAAVTVTNVRVIDEAKPSTLPANRSAAANIAGGSGFGLAAGAALAYLLERRLKKHLDITLGRPGSAASLLNVPELGVIPSSDMLETRKQQWLPRFGKQAVLVSPSGSPSPLLNAVTESRPSLLAESFRATLTSIALQYRDGHRPSVIVVTSPSPGEGKSTVVTNLGMTMAEASDRVLIIDADLLRPRLHKVFGFGNDVPGLSDIILDEAPIDTIRLDTFIKPTTTPGLFLLTSGKKTPNTSQILYSPRIRPLLSRLRHAYDWVLIDAPPMLYFSEARVLGRLSDGVVLVLRAGQTSRDSALASRHRLSEDATPILGTILNDWRPDKADGQHIQNLYFQYYADDGVSKPVLDGD